MVIAAGGSHFDAVALLFQYSSSCDVRRTAEIGDGWPLFCHASGGAISTEEVRRMVRRVVQAAGAILVRSCGLRRQLPADRRCDGGARGWCPP